MVNDLCGAYEVETWRLRSAGATPIGRGIFLVQGFGAEKNDIEIYTAATELPETEDFIGANPDANYVQANFQRLPFSYNGQQIFQGSMTRIPEFKQEYEIPGEEGSDWR